MINTISRPPAAAMISHSGMIKESGVGVGEVVCGVVPVVTADISPNGIFALTIKLLRFSNVIADTTDAISSGATVTFVSTNVVDESRRLVDCCSETEVICTAEALMFSAFTTPDKYAMRVPSLNSALLIKSVAVNVAFSISPTSVVVQSDRKTLPTSLVIPSGHGWQAPLPASVLYVPVPHREQERDAVTATIPNNMRRYRAGIQ